MLSAVCFGAVKIGSMACGTDAAVLLAARDDRAAETAPPRVELSGTLVVGVIVLAAVIVLGGGALEHVAGTLKHGELGVAVRELVVKLPKSSSCD
jgi:hypothetical protein